MAGLSGLLLLLLLAFPCFAVPPHLSHSRFDDHQDEGSAGCTAPGLFSWGCDPEVIVCTNEGNIVQLMCPFGLFFDEISQQCLLPSYVCPHWRSFDDPVVASSSDLPKSFCTGLPDGFHPISACSSSVGRCSNGTATLLECPAGQVYTKDGCRNMDSVSECQSRAHDDECSSDGLFEVDTCSPLFLACATGISRMMTCPWPLVFDATHQLCNYDYEVEGCPVKPNTLCPSDGFYSYGNCTDTFYACTGDFVQPMYCPSHLAFDGQRKICDYPMAVAECHTTEGSAGHNETEENAIGESNEEASGNVKGSSSGAGSGLSEGDSSGVSSGEGSGLSSGEGSGTSSGEGSGEAGTSTNFGDELVSPYTRTLDNFCNSRADGFYAHGCSSTLTGCSNGITYSLYCPANLAFDEKLVICNYPKAVPACHEEGSGSGSGEASSEITTSGDRVEGGNAEDATVADPELLSY